MRYTYHCRFLIAALGAAVIFFDTPAFAQNGYKSGKALFAENAETSQKENGFFVNVPIDYKDPSKGFTEIYAHFRKPFNPALPTYVLFTGGPGQSSHFPSGGKADMYGNLGYNFLLFDQRGIAFSRPETEQLWKDPNFHSSENNANDLEEIRKYLKLEKISVYGASYGTVPATIYGHMYPKQTRSVILEGVVYDGFDKTPQNDRFLDRVIQRYFNSLDSNVTAKLNRISNDVIMPKMWFPGYVQAFLAFSGTQSLPVLTKMLEQATLVDDDKFRDEFNKAQALVNKSEAANNEVRVPSKIMHEDLVNALLLAKEFGMARTDISTQLILENGKIVRQVTGEMSMYVTEAKKLGLPIGAKSTYSAVNYPLNVPTYYLNGSRDGATIPPWLIKHWKNVPRANAYLLILKEGGHMPGGQILKFGMTPEQEVGSQAKEFFEVLFKSMLDAKPLSKVQIETWNNLGSSKMAFTSKTRLALKCEILFR